MIQAKFSLDKDQIQFLEQYEVYGFKNKSALIRAALNQLRRDMERKALQESADLYAEVYEEDGDLKSLAASSLEDWPE